MDFEIRYQFGETVYQNRSTQPEHVAHRVRQILLDGRAINDLSFPLLDDKQAHRVIVTMGIVL